MVSSLEDLSGPVFAPYVNTSRKLEAVLQWSGYHTWQGIEPKNVSARPELVCIHELHSEVLQPQLM